MKAEGEGWDPANLAYASKLFITDRSTAVLLLWYFLLIVM